MIKEPAAAAAAVVNPTKIIVERLVKAKLPKGLLDLRHLVDPAASEEQLEAAMSVLNGVTTVTAKPERQARAGKRPPIYI